MLLQCWLILYALFNPPPSLAAPHSQQGSVEIERLGYHRGVQNISLVKVQYRNHPFDPKTRSLLSEVPDRFLYQPIRFRWHVTESLKNSTDESNVQWLWNEVLPKAAEFWSKTLSIIPVEGNLILSEAHLRRRRYCGWVENEPVPKEHLTVGVPDTDLLVYVTAAETKCADNVLAFAQNCNYDAYDRPIAGVVALCLDEIPYPRTSSVTHDYTQVVIHELAHIMGMAVNNYIYYWDSVTKQPRSPRPYIFEAFTCADGSTRLLGVPANTTLYIDDNHNSYIVTPRVRTVVKNHFNCPSLIGAALEKDLQFCYGSPHWKERFFATELMSAYYIQTHGRSTISPLTLALLEDSGWYVADYEQADVSPFGHQSGCSFVQDSCLIPSMDGDNQTPIVPDSGRGTFCGYPLEWGCSVDLRRKQQCDVREYRFDTSPRYFANPKLGGPAFMDYCPVFSAQIGIDCTGRAINASQG